jgi:hypothetical protein
VRPSVVLDGKRVVGVDPGRRDLVSCAWKDESGVATFSNYSNQEYQEKIGLRKVQEKC